MSPALMLLTCTLAADAPAPMPAPAPAPVVVAAPVADHGGGCVGCGGGVGGCGSCATGICPGGQDPNPMEKTGLFARLKARLKKPFTGLSKKDSCDSCDSSPKLFGRLRGWNAQGGHVHSAGCGCASAAAGHSVAYGLPSMTGCALPPIPGSVPPAPPAAAPEKMAPVPAGEGKPVPNKVNVAIPEVIVPTPPAPAGKPAF